ncbi:MAG: Wzz/FepE/Etk N-terminal domain-containing protein [Lachnospiraceae bacterium]|nr:Wzz/FepE/Etk N-terminal domain-containing protein [Lachnospiraceae bacterium]
MDNSQVITTNQNQNNEEIEIDLREIFGVLLSRWVLIVAVGLICAVAAGIFTKLCITPMYQSTTKIYVLSKGDAGSSSSVSQALTSITDMQLGSQILTDYQAMITCDPVMEKVIKNLELDLKNEELAAMLSINNPTNTRILELTVTNKDPYIAKEIADEVAKVSIEYCAGIMNVEPSNVFQYAKASKEKSSPNTMKNILIALLAGVIVVSAIIVVRYLLDDTIQSQEDVEKYLGLNTLGLIPIEEGAMSQMKKDKKKRNKELRG